jgi:membrane-associated HD superfamily phosphohydrolase
MPNYSRMFAYGSAGFTIGVMIYIFTNLFLPFTQTQDWVGTLVQLAYATVYLSVLAAFSRRFISKTTLNESYPYFLVPIVVGPMIVITILKDEFALSGDQIIFYLLIFAGAAYGARLGIRAGHKRREVLIERLKQRQPVVNKPTES